jgi:hypothetical protein
MSAWQYAIQVAILDVAQAVGRRRDELPVCVRIGNERKAKVEGVDGGKFVLVGLWLFGDCTFAIYSKSGHT